MADRIEGGGFTPEQIKMYKQEYKQAADLFERTLDEHAKSDNRFQREEFRDVMQQAMDVLKETTRALKKDKLSTQCSQIEKDWAAYQKEGGDMAKAKLHTDLENAKKLT